MIRSALYALAGLALALPTQAASALGSEAPGFATCAVYYFLAARGHGLRDYDRLYTAGEFSLNQAIQRHGISAANAKMATTSGGMMQEIHHDWRKIEILDQRYGAPCETLLRDANYEFR